MKRFAAALMALALAFCLAPRAFASQSLARPGMGQVLILPADSFESFTLDFNLSALEELSREGADLILRFNLARIELRGFFAEDVADSHGLIFADGRTVGAADFDADGQYTGSYCAGYSREKADPDAEARPLSSGTGADTLTVTKSINGTAISRGGEAVYGALRANAMAAVEEYLTRGGADWGTNSAIKFEFTPGADDSVTPIRETLTGADGLIAINSRPDTVYMPDAGSLIAIGEGRAYITFKNSLGETLQKLAVRVAEAAGGKLTIECACPSCQDEQGEALHMLSCGHYSCAADFDAAAHGVPACGIAGHCASDGASHEKCTNCLKPLCTGDGRHGYGVCPHEHTWMQQSYTSPTTTSAGESVSKCKTCEITYRQVLPMLAG